MIVFINFREPILINVLDERGILKRGKRELTSTFVSLSDKRQKNCPETFSEQLLIMSYQMVVLQNYRRIGGWIGKLSSI